MQKPTTSPTRIDKPAYFANWADLWAFPLAKILLPIFIKIPFLTPNVITIISFFTYAFGSISLFLNYPYHLIMAAILIISGFLGDDLDGQVARARKLSSAIGNYLDKAFDVLKIYILTASLSFAVYLQTQNVFAIFLGFTASFFFSFRYYIKLETVFSCIDRDPEYLSKSARKRNELENHLEKLHEKLWKTPIGKLKSLWFKNRIIFFVDEAEFAFFTAIGAVFNQLEITLWILAISQVIITIWRFYERGRQVATSSERLLWPMRK